MKAAEQRSQRIVYNRLNKMITAVPCHSQQQQQQEQLPFGLGLFQSVVSEGQL